MQLQLGSVQAETPRLAVIECCASVSRCVYVGVNACVSLCACVSLYVLS